MNKFRLQWLFTMVFALGMVFNVNAQYCAAGPSSTADSNVQQVDLAGDATSISHTGCPGVTGVQNLTGTQSADLTANSSYNLNITFGTCGGNFGGTGAAWVDWNQDGDFTDLGEQIVTSSGTPGSGAWAAPVVTNFTVPAGAWNGNTRLRVMQQEGGTAASCNTFTWGSVMDFNIAISGGFTPPCANPSLLSISNLTTVGADVSWNSAGTTLSSEVHVLPAGSAPPTAGTAGNQGAQTSPYTYSAGSSSTSYDVYVRDICASPDVSDWVSAGTFTTLPNCGDNLTGLCYNQNGFQVLVNFEATPGDWAQITINAGGTETCCDELVLYDGLNGTGNIIFGALTGGGNSDYSGNIIISTTGQISMAINADGSVTCATSGFTPFDVIVDCVPPPSVEDLEVTDATDVSATASWTTDAGSCASGGPYTVDVLQGGLSIGGAYPLTGVTSTSVSLTGLTVATEYSVVVSADCDPAGAQEVIFSTLNCLPGDRCSYTLTCRDFGDAGGVTFDGWTSGAVVQVTAGGQVSTYNVPPGTYGGQTELDFTVLACPGDILTVELIGTLDDGEGWSLSGPGGLDYTPADPSQSFSLTSCPTCAPALASSTSAVCETGVDVSWTNGAAYDSVFVRWSYFVPPFFTFEGNSDTLRAGIDLDLENISVTPSSPWPLNTTIGYSIISFCGDEQSQLDGSFTTPSCPCADQCYYALRGCDTFGDGWNGHSFDIVLDGLVVATMVVDDPAGTSIDNCNEGYIFNDTIYTCPGQLLEVVHTDGAFDSEVSFTLTSSLEGLIYTYNGTGTSGTLFSTTTCPPCLPITDLAIGAFGYDGVSADTATVVWNDPNGASFFDVAVELAGGTANAATYSQVTDTFFLASFGAPDTDYTVYVAALCDAGPGDTLSINVTTPPACLAVQDLAAINLASDSARIVWSDPGAANFFGAGATSYSIAVELAGGTAAAGTYSVVTDTTSLATGLNVATAYTAYVVSTCAAGQSDTLAVNFTTTCPPSFPAPFAQSFDGATIPTCWTQSAGSGGPWVFVTTSPGSPFCSAGLTEHTGNGGRMAAIDMSSTDTNVSLVAPVVDVSSLTVPQVSFYYNACNANSAAINTIAVEAADGAGGWLLVGTINTLTAGWEQKSFDVSGFTYGAGLVQIRLRANDSAVASAFHSDLHVDDFAIEEAPACPAPSGMTALNVTTTGADLSWNAGGSELLWDLHIVDGGSPAPAEADPGNTPNLAATAHTIPDTLDIGQAVDVYYRAECGPADTSEWVLYSFSTLSLSDFYCQNGPTSGADSNIDSIGITGDLASQISYLNPCPGITGVNDQTAASPTVELEAGISYTLTVEFSSCGGNFANAGQAWVDWNQNFVFDAGESIGSSAGTPGTAAWAAPIDFTFTVPASATEGVTVMRVKQQEGGTLPLNPCVNGVWGSAIDFAVNVTNNFSCIAVSGIAASNITQVGADITWNAGGAETLWDLHFANSGDPAPLEADPGTNPDLATTAFTIPDTLSIGTTYDVYVRADCGAGLGVSPWELYSFSTLSLSDNYCAAGPTSSADSNIGSISITGDAGSSIAYTNSCPGILGVNDQTSLPALELEAGLSYSLQFVMGTCGGNFGNAAQVWIDYDNSGTFDPSESIGSASATPTSTQTFNFTVPFTAANGASVGMRAMQREGGSPPMDPCATYTWGSVIDFAVNLTNTNPCPGASALDITVTGASTATLTWNEVGSATTWLVESLGGPAQGTPGNDTLVVSGTPSADFTGLVAGQVYYAWVASDCGTDTSAWSSIAWVQPAPGATCDLPIEVSLPYNSGTLSTAGFGDDYSTSPCSNAYMGGDDIVFRYSPVADGCIEIDFLAVDTWMGLHILDGCPDDPGTSCLFPDGGSPDLFSSATGLRSVTGFNVTAGQDIYFVVSTFPSPQSGSFSLEINECPPCNVPSGIAASSITGSSANVSWTSNNPGADYFYAYGPTGFTIGGAGQEGSGSGGPTDGTDTIALAGLTGSTPYQVCVWENCEVLNPGDGGSDTLCVTFNTLITNDDCVNALPIACDDVIAGFTTGATPSTLGAGNFTGSNENAPDVWFTFVGSNIDDALALAGTPGNSVTLSTCNDGGATAGSASYDTKIDIYSGTCGAPVFIGGNDDGGGCTGFSSLFNFPTVVGETYYVRMYGFSTFSSGNFNLAMICEAPCLPVPANDNCSAPELVTLQPYGTATYLSGTTECSSPQPYPGCGSTFASYNGVWYQFTTDASGQVYAGIQLGTLPAGQLGYAIYNTAPCDGATSSAVCSTFQSGLADGTLFNLSPSTTYKMMVFNVSGQEGSFDLLLAGPPPPPANDECANAEPITVGTGVDCSGAVAGTLISATQSATPALGGCATQTNGYNDVWYVTTVPASGRVRIDFPTKPGANMFSELYIGADCGSLTPVPLSCSAISPKMFPVQGGPAASALTPGATLYIRVWDAFNDNFGNFTICVTDPTPANDNCATAQALTVEEHGINNWTAGNTFGAFGGTSCLGGNAAERVWYSFEATDADQNIFTRATGGNSFDAVVEVFDGCGGTSLGCFNNYGAGVIERTLVTGLTKGNTYYYSVYNLGGIGTVASSAFETQVDGFHQDHTLRAISCNVSGLTLDQTLYSERDNEGELYVNPAVLVNGYSYRFVGGGIDVVVDRNSTTGFFLTLEDVPGLQYNTSYDVTVRHRVVMTVNGFLDAYWSDFGPVCTVALGDAPTTTLLPEFCVAADDYLLGDQIFAEVLAGATDYRFNFTPSGGGATLSEVSPNYAVVLQTVGPFSGPGLQYGLSYNVTVDALIGGVWSNGVEVCTIFMAIQPENTNVRAQYCPSVKVYPSNQIILAEVVNGGEYYEWQFTPIGGGAALSKVTISYSFQFGAASLPFMPGTTYNVQVRAFAGGQLGDYDDTGCQVTIQPAPSMEGIGADVMVFDNKALDASAVADLYPNPNSGENLFISLTELEDEYQSVVVEVVDLAGKVVHQEQVASSGKSTNFVITFNERLAKGMYFVNLYLDNTKLTEKLSVE